MSLLGIILLVVLLLFLHCKGSQFGHDKFRRSIPFDPVVWQAIDEHHGEIKDRYTRCYMYKDLVKKHLHIGMSYEEVIRLLGEPMGVAYYINPEIKRVDYDIGDCGYRCYSEVSDIKGYWLFIDFDRNSKLINFGHSYDYDENLKKNNALYLEKIQPLFSCNYDNKCTRSIRLSEAKKPGYSDTYCYNDKECERIVKIEDEYGVIKGEECQKSEVEAKWGYKVW